MDEKEWNQDYEKVKKTNNIIFCIVLFFSVIVALVIYYIITSPFWYGGYYISDFGAKTKLSQNDYNKIVDIMDIQEDIEISKIAYQQPFRHESVYYIFYNEKDTNKECIFQHVVMQTNIDEDYLMVKHICDKYYKRWQNPFKHIDIDYSKIVNL